MDSSTVASTQSVTRTLEDYDSRKVNNDLGKDEFLKILAAQMANQNPLEPATDTEFIAQLAQFSALEQLQNMNTGFTTSQAYSLLGKYVFASKDVEGQAKPQEIFGKVEGTVKLDGIDYLIIDGAKYKLSSVTGVMDPEVIEEAQKATAEEAAATEAQTQLTA